jgi:hypothetical protein
MFNQSAATTRTRVATQLSYSCFAFFVSFFSALFALFCGYLLLPSDPTAKRNLCNLRILPLLCPFWPIFEIPPTRDRPTTLPAAPRKAVLTAAGYFPIPDPFGIRPESLSTLVSPDISGASGPDVQSPVEAYPPPVLANFDILSVTAPG